MQKDLLEMIDEALKGNLKSGRSAGFSIKINRKQKTQQCLKIRELLRNSTLSISKIIGQQ